MGQERKIYVVDTNVLIYDPKSVDILRAGNNILIIPFVVQFFELDRLKTRPETQMDARDAMRLVESIYEEGDVSLEIYDSPKMKFLGGLNREIADHQIVATTLMAMDEVKRGNYAERGFRNPEAVRLISRDRNVRILARKFGVEAEDYQHNKTEKIRYKMPSTINVNLNSKRVQAILPKENKKEHKRLSLEEQDNKIIYSFPYEPENHGDVKINEGVICFSNQNGQNWKESFVAIRKGDLFRSLPKDINAMGIRPHSINGNGPNWNQHIALGQLLDPEIKLVFLQGGAGTGKTLLAVAAALHQRHSFRNIIVTRPPVHIGGIDRLGFLPGDLKEKLSPWMMPIEQSIDYIKEYGVAEESGRSIKKEIDQMLGNNGGNGGNSGAGNTGNNSGKLRYMSIDLFKGHTFHKVWVIVDEAQDLTPHHIKALLTRPGIDTKMIFTGDVGQIDSTTRIDERSSGLTYAMVKMAGDPLVAATNFAETVRSPLAQLSEKLL